MVQLPPQFWKFFRQNARDVGNCTWNKTLQNGCKACRHSLHYALCTPIFDIIHGIVALGNTYSAILKPLCFTEKRHYTLSLYKSHNAPLPPPKKVLHRHCLRFLLKHLYVAVELQTMIMQNFGGVKEVCYGICASSFTYPIVLFNSFRPVFTGKKIKNLALVKNT